MNLTDAHCDTCWIGGKCHRREDCAKLHGSGEDGAEFFFKLRKKCGRPTKNDDDKKEENNAQRS